jgi:hypothetical protein
MQTHLISWHPMGYAMNALFVINTSLGESIAVQKTFQLVGTATSGTGRSFNG